MTQPVYKAGDYNKCVSYLKGGSLASEGSFTHVPQSVAWTFMMGLWVKVQADGEVMSRLLLLMNTLTQIHCAVNICHVAVFVLLSNNL